MTIEVMGHKITPSLGNTFYDIARISTVKTGKNAGKQTEIIEGYGVTLERCFRIIQDNETVKQLEGQKVSLDKYLKTYNQANQNLLKEIQRLEASLS